MRWRPKWHAASHSRPHTCTRQPSMCLPLPSFGLGASRPAWRLKNGHNSMPRFGANISLESATVPALGLAVAPEVACGFTHALGIHPNPPHPLAPARGATPRLGANPPCHLATPLNPPSGLVSESSMKSPTLGGLPPHVHPIAGWACRAGGCVWWWGVGAKARARARAHLAMGAWPGKLASGPIFGVSRGGGHPWRESSS